MHPPTGGCLCNSRRRETGLGKTGAGRRDPPDTPPVPPRPSSQSPLEGPGQGLQRRDLSRGSFPDNCLWPASFPCRRHPNARTEIPDRFFWVRLLSSDAGGGEGTSRHRGKNAPHPPARTGSGRHTEAAPPAPMRMGCDVLPEEPHPILSGSRHTQSYLTGRLRTFRNP